MSIIIVPLIFSVLLSLIIVFIPSITATQTTQTTPLRGFDEIIANLPANIPAIIAEMTAHQILIYIMALYFFTPLFLIMTVMTSSVISSDSFVGEKEHKAIQALLVAPISDGELLIVKVLPNFIPARATLLRHKDVQKRRNSVQISIDLKWLS